MYLPKLELKSFQYLSSERKKNCLRALLEALIAINREFLLEYPNTPLIYEHDPDYVFKKRPFQLDSWQDIPRTIELRSGDCKDFACWRIAELRQMGYTDVSPYIKENLMVNPANPNEKITVYHIQVRVGLKIEDPSVLLGMPSGNVPFNRIKG
jgi:hypothetical protein